jgi:SAM-dependent methyltransferase
MLLGVAHLQELQSLLARWCAPEEQRHIRALDAGCGLGRVTKEVLCWHFLRTELVDFNPACLAAAKKSLQETDAAKLKKVLGSDTGLRLGFHLSDLVSFPVELHEPFNCVVLQWTLMHLTDCEALFFLSKCAANIAGVDGVIFVGESVSTYFSQNREVAGWNRSQKHWEALFTKAGLYVQECREWAALSGDEDLAAFADCRLWALKGSPVTAAKGRGERRGRAPARARAPAPASAPEVPRARSPAPLRLGLGKRAKPNKQQRQRQRTKRRKLELELDQNRG